MATLEDLLRAAIEHHQSGRLAEAEQLYRQILTEQPRHADAWYLLGLVAAQAGRDETAIEYFDRAVQINGAQPLYHHYLGQACQSLGRVAEARRALEKALELNPALAISHFQLGILEHRSDALAAADRHYQRAIDLQPDLVEAHVNRGDLLRAGGRFEESARAYQTAVRWRPECIEALANWGATLIDLGKFDEACDCLEKLLRLQPKRAEAHYNLGKARHGLGLRREAMASYQQALDLRPDFVPAILSLGIVRQEQGDLAAAADAYCEVLRLDPNSAQALANYGKVLHMQGETDAALEYYNRALQLAPDLDVAHFNRVVWYNERGQPDRALELCRRALELTPDSARLYKNMAISLRQQGASERALACYRRAIELEPDNAVNHGDFIYTLNFLPNDPATMFAEHLAWAKKHTEPLTAQAVPCGNEPNPHRRLRVGYISPYFRRHAVNYFTEPLLVSHDHGLFEIFCYSDVRRPDATTERIQAAADTWREIRQLSDEQLAQVVRDDRIDILVDLTGHIGGHRLLTFARNPAPIQVTYIGYPNTTGMSAMDYRFTDAWSDPPGLTDRFHTERLVRLSEAFFCYRPPDDAPPLTELPALSAGHVTFGSFNSYMKVTPAVVATWLEILARVPDSRMLILAYWGGQLEREWHALAAERGIDPTRIELCDVRPTADYLRLQQQADIALDTFPVNGHTTTCDSIWMGVPVVMFAGEVHASRLGGSVLVNVGLENLIARSMVEYVDLAVELASDIPRLTALRGGLRERMAQSVLLDFAGFTRKVEVAYRQMWIEWCQSRQTMG